MTLILMGINPRIYIRLVERKPISSVAKRNPQLYRVLLNAIIAVIAVWIVLTRVLTSITKITPNSSSNFIVDLSKPTKANEIDKLLVSDDYFTVIDKHLCRPVSSNIHFVYTKARVHSLSIIRHYSLRMMKSPEFRPAMEYMF